MEEIVVIRYHNRTEFARPKYMGSVILATLALMPMLAQAADKDTEERIKESGNVLKELLNGPNGVPLSVLNKSECVIILPSVKKVGFIVAGSYGRGVMSCRSGQNFDGAWSAPVMMQSSGGSVGFQAGGQATDFVVLVMNDKGARAVLNGKAKLGADASVAAGPVGRDAEASTNAAMSAQMLSYSLGPDSGANEKVYGKKVTGKEIFGGTVQAPASAEVMLSTLKKKSPSNASRGKS
jgi:lipid-binding SYLF domain-containing protein